MAGSSATEAPQTSPELHLLVDLNERETRTHWHKILAGSLIVHAVLFTAGTKIPAFVSEAKATHAPTLIRTPLYFPRLTQREPNRTKPSPTIDINGLLARDRENSAPSVAQRPTARKFEAPPVQSHPQAPAVQPKIVAQAPQIQPPAPANAGNPNGLALNTQTPPPPSAGPFQDIGSEADVVRPAHPAIPIPKANIDTAMQGLSPAGSGPHVSLGEDNAAPGALASDSRNAVQHAAVELESDPQGADLRPYLLEALRIIKANWRRVLPESARLGLLHGRTTVQLAMERDGHVLKLVVADSSGSSALDRAAVAGVSMSDPLPPLPNGFKGEQVKLAFTFSCQPNQ